MKILFCGEASFLKSGYAIYGNNLISRIHAISGFEVAEFANYGSKQDVRVESVPWKMYCNLPENDSEFAVYNSNPLNHFGAWKFEKVCLDFKPDVVVSYLDSWMMRHQAISPLKKHYKLIWMPAVDASPQNTQWLDMYASIDGVFGYTDWSLDILNSQSNGKIKTVCSAPYCSEKEYIPIQNKNLHKINMGMGNAKIIGFISRNQKRKLFPDLFQAFKKYIDKYKEYRTVLYCHTTYPDGGWNIPQLLKDTGLTNKVFFTYLCLGCGNISPSLFHDAGTLCPNCGKIQILPKPDIPVPSSAMANILNLFDLYVHYANSEAWGMAQIEAAACGVPVMSIDYAGMHDIVKNIGGIPLTPKGFSKELETGCLRAIPDNDDLVEKLNNFFKLPESLRLSMGYKTRRMFEQNYNWDTVVNKWIDYIKSIKLDSEPWDKFTRIKNIPPNNTQNITNSEYVRWLIVNVLQDNTKIASALEANILRNLTFGMDMESYPVRNFNRDDAYNLVKSIAENSNYWNSQNNSIIQESYSENTTN